MATRERKCRPGSSLNAREKKVAIDKAHNAGMRKSRGYPGSVRFPSDYTTAPLRHPCDTSCFSCLANVMPIRSRKQTAKGQAARSHPFVSRPFICSFFSASRAWPSTSLFVRNSFSV